MFRNVRQVATLFTFFTNFNNLNMKKILLIFCLLIFSGGLFAQFTQPTHVKKPKTFQPGNWYMVGNWDYVSGSYKDTIGYYLEGDTIYHWANKYLKTIGNISISGNLTTTNGNFYGSNNGWFCGYDTLFEGALKMAGVGKLNGSLLTGTYRTNSFVYIENTDVTFFGFNKLINNLDVKSSKVIADSNKLQVVRYINNRKLCTTYMDTAIIMDMPSKMIMSADSGGNHFKVYVPTITKNLTVHGTITSGGLINKDTVINLGDGKTFNFPTQSVGWAEIQCDSVLTELTWGNVSWNGDGATSLRSNGAKFVNTDIDGNYACFYDGGSSYAILKNTSGYTQTYSIKYHYHY